MANNKPDFKGQTKTVFDSIMNPEEIGTSFQDPEEANKKHIGRPRNVGYTRTSVILNDEQISKIRYISGIENVLQKDIIEKALQLFLDKYEATHGEINIEATSKKRDVNSLF